MDKVSNMQEQMDYISKKKRWKFTIQWLVLKKKGGLRDRGQKSSLESKIILFLFGNNNKIFFS